MSNEEEIEKYRKYFEALGAEDPESWARSQVNEGIPQYATFVFLREAWRGIIGDGETEWIKTHIAESDRQPRDPGAGIGPALKRLLAAGADPADIAEVARVMQWELLSWIMYQLSDSSSAMYPSEDLPVVNWGLFVLNEDDEPVQPLNGLHESVLSLEPSGREMRPRGVTREG